MNPRKQYSSSSLKFIIYAILIISSVSIILQKFNPNTRNPTFHQQRACTTTTTQDDQRRRIIDNLEPLISTEPSQVWEGLGTQEKKIKYLSSMIDLHHKDRFIYIDLGARDYDSSIGNWFVKQYPKQNKSFEIYAVEADKSFHQQYAHRKGVNLLPYAAWVRNETVVFGSKPIVVKDKVWRKRPFGRIEGRTAEEDGMSAVTRVEGFDFADWLKRTVRESDFVVVKMDVEGTEIDLIRDLEERGAICLIDELFMECHFDRYVKCCSGERINRFNFSYAQCYHLFAQLRTNGCVVHQWW